MTISTLMAATIDPDKCEGTRDPWWFIFAPPEQDLTDALDAAQPMEGEVVMNTHFVGETEEEWAARGEGL